MVNEASDELAEIAWDDRMKPEVLAVRVDLYHAAKNWELMADMAKHLAESQPDQSEGWMHWAYALRAQEAAQEAKQGLWGEPTSVAPWDWRKRGLGSSGVIIPRHRRLEHPQS